MGVDIDIKQHLSQAKLTESQYDQPVTELDAVTESTERNNIEVLLQILNVVQRRLGERISNTENNFAFMVSLGEDQRLIIAFPGTENERAINENQDGNRWFGRIARLMQNEQQEMNEMRPVRRQMQRIRPLPLLPQLFPRRMENRQNRMQQIRQRQMQMQLEQEWIHSLNIISESNEIESPQLPEIEEQRQVPQLRLQGSIARVEQNLNIPNQTIVQNNQDRVENILRENDSTLDQIHLNQNSKHLIRPKLRMREEEMEEPLSCWQTFTRTIANFFRRSP